MKSRKGRTVITIETIQRTTIRSRKTAKIALCDRCAAVIPLSPPAAQPDLEATTRRLFPADNEQTEDSNEDIGNRE